MKRPDLRALAPWLGVGLLMVVLVAWFWHRGPGVDRDDYALYLLHAESIVEGRAYSDTGFIPTSLDIAPPAQPPGLPLVLAATYLLAGGFSWPVVKIAMALLGALAVLVPGLYFAKVGGTRLLGVAVSVFLAIGWAPTLIQPETDLGFVALVWLALAVLDLPEGEWTWRRTLLVLLIGTFAMSFRAVGVALVPAVAWFTLANRHRLGLRPGVPLAVWMAVGVGVIVAMGGWSVVVAQAPSDVAHLVSRAMGRITVYGRGIVVAFLHPFPWDVANDVFNACALGVSAVGLASWTRSSWRTAAWGFAASYTSMLLVVSAGSTRYLMPLFPVLLYGFLRGTEIAVRAAETKVRGQSTYTRTMTGAVASVIIAMGALRLAGEPRTGGLLTELPDTKAMVDALREDGDPEEPRVVFMQPRVLTWSTGFPAMVMPPAPPSEIMPELERKGITHVILDDLRLGVGRNRRMEETIATYACRFRPFYENDSYRLYEVVDGCPPTD